MEFNTPKAMGKGAKVLITNKTLDLTVNADKIFMSADINAKDLGKTESGRIYKLQINREKFTIGNRTFVLNAYMVEIVDKPTPKAKVQKPKMKKLIM